MAQPPAQPNIICRKCGPSKTVPKYILAQKLELCKECIKSLYGTMTCETCCDIKSSRKCFEPFTRVCTSYDCSKCTTCKWHYSWSQKEGRVICSPDCDTEFISKYVEDFCKK